MSADLPPLDPGALAVLNLVKASGRPPYHTMDPLEARDLYERGRVVLQPEPPAVADVRDITIPGPAGPMKARVYRGVGAPATGARGLIFFHGGGWVFGTLDTHDVPCRQIANAAECVVVSVDYRLAPEHKFPAGPDDATAATRWIGANTAALGIDPGRLAIGGDSAGGNLAIVAALEARDGGGPKLAYQLLIYPATDMTGELPSHKQFTEGLPLVHITMCWFRDLYLRGKADWTDWRASPLFAKSFAGLPPAYVLLASHDPLRSEGEAYAEKLRAVGVAAEMRVMQGHIHGFATMGKLVKAAEPAVAEAARAMKRALG